MLRGLRQLGEQGNIHSLSTTVGADRRFGDKLVLAVGSGLAHERQQTGDNGHATEATATRRASLLGLGLPITKLR